MNDGNQALNLIYLLVILVAVLSAFSVRRVQLGQTLKMVFAWVLIFAALFAIFALREDFLALGNRLWAAVTGNDNQEVQGGELRIAMAGDGHFWADGQINGRDVRFLIDSGATVTTIGPETARGAGVEPTGGAPWSRPPTGSPMSTAAAPNGWSSVRSSGGISGVHRPRRRDQRDRHEFPVDLVALERRRADPGAAAMTGAGDRARSTHLSLFYIMYIIGLL